MGVTASRHRPVGPEGQGAAVHVPFDAKKLNGLLDEAGVDLVLATSKHNVQYLLGGFRSVFFSHLDAIGLSRYLPAVGIPRGRVEEAFFVGNTMEAWQQAVEPVWAKTVRTLSWSSEATAREVAGLLRGLGLAKGAVAVERPFLPADAFAVLQWELPDVRWVEALPILEELRAIKRPDELRLLREASEAIVGSMLAVMQGADPGITTREMARHMHQEEANRGLNFEYALIATGPSHLRAPSEARWGRGAILSIDSGGNKQGYIGDLCRMAVMGRATPMMRELLGEVQAVQAVARAGVRPGAAGGGIYEAALAEQARCPHGGHMVFLAHGMGLISHEVPHLTSTGFVPYAATHVGRLLEPGMVLSIETELRHPEVGFVKLEDTVAVTPDGFEAYGDAARDWVEVTA